MTIVGCLLEYNGKFLILLRRAHKPNGGTWGLPAGKVERGEDNESAMIRELYEETGYKAIYDELEHLGDFKFGTPTDSYTFATYRVQTQELPNVKIEDTAHEVMKWVTPKECYAIPNLITDLHELLKKIDYIPTSSNT